MYKTISEEGLYHFDKMMKQLINDGYRPLFNVVVTSHKETGEATALVYTQQFYKPINP